MPGARWQNLALAAVALVGTGAVALAVWLGTGAKSPDTTGPQRPTERQNGLVTFKRGIDPITSYGLETTPAQQTDWQPRLFVDGRVVPNPQATLEVRAPFAGVVSTESATPLFRVGAHVEAGRTLALLEARFSPLEKLDLKAKSASAEASFLGAEEIVKIRQERVQRLGQMQAGTIARGEVDLAGIQFTEAKMQKDIALLQWNLWKQALASVGKNSIVVPIPVPSTGEIAFIGAQGGTNVEAGQLLVRIVDFQRVLLRLDFPLSQTGAAAPAGIEAEALADAANPPHWRAVLRGPAPAIEIALQKSSFFYEIVPSENGIVPSWRPGLYVKAIMPDPDASPQSVRAIPASALLVHQGRTLVYIQINERRYERSEVTILGRQGDTLYVTSGVRAGDRVVSKHAQVLLSEEFRSDTDDD
jgi:biotin carboxyl carrier protein